MLHLKDSNTFPTQHSHPMSVIEVSWWSRSLGSLPARESGTDAPLGQWALTDGRQAGNEQRHS